MRFLLLLLIVLMNATSASFLHAEDFLFGFSKVDITPTESIRLSGYGNRDKSFEGIDEKLYARVMVISNADRRSPHVLVSVDTIGFPGVLTKTIFEEVQKQHQIPRSQFVICCTHSHTAPHLAGGLSNLFAAPLTESDQAKTEAYTASMKDQIVVAVQQAIESLSPGILQTGSGTATFAKNRRVLKDGVWTGFGINPEGPVDHTLPVLLIKDPSGVTTRGVVFNYACHCTTFGGDYNRVNGDWAGYASKMLEEAFPEAIALCTIGCGADANPERDSKHALEIAQRQGQEIADSVQSVTAQEGQLSRIDAGVSTNFGYAGLPIDRPTDQQMQEALKSPRQQVRHHAEVMIDTKKRMGRLPETYPMPIQVWRFGNQFAMVFLGGEVCVDYALRIKKELPVLAEGLTSDCVWVSAYSNDVFAYVAPERMRAEGGYEVDFSMIYYLQPGRWSSGTEEVIIRRVKELFQDQNLDVPRSVEDALQAFSVPAGMKVGVVASEPLIRDPINFALDERGRLWVVEMGDYPRGNPEMDLSQIQRHEPWDGPPAGRIKVLYDDDQDGQYDRAELFLSGLSFPTGVFPWRDGVLISGAPDLIFARDTNGDDQCDETEVLYSGFEKANPQHRIAGFEYGLDGWLYLSAGTNNKVITSLKTGEQVNVSGRDCRIHPDSGKIEPVSGQSQYGRSRDDFGNWFGNNNSLPLYQYVIRDQDLSRNPHVASPSPRHFLTEPAAAPPVYPTSRTLDRFNDLFALDRFTSACSPTVFRDDSLGADVYGSIMICEPVHNLVSRVIVDRTEIKFSGRRAASEQQSEFLSSSDNWFRPVRLMASPEGALWICDMYRHVIEHPEWIPEAWQAKLDLYAGFHQGRIYRLYPESGSLSKIEDLSKLSSVELVDRLTHTNGWVRDTAQRLLVHRSDANETNVVTALKQLLRASTDKRVLIQAGFTYSLLTEEPSELLRLLDSDDSDIVISALRGLKLIAADHVVQLPDKLLSHPSERVRYELALAAGNLSPEVTVRVLERLMLSDSANPWMRAAILSSASHVADQLLVTAIERKEVNRELLNPLLATLLGSGLKEGFSQLSVAMQKIESESTRQQLLLTALESLERRGNSYEKLRGELPAEATATFDQIVQAAVQQLVQNSPAGQYAAVTLKLASYSKEPLTLAQLQPFLTPTNSPSIVTAAIDAILRIHGSSSLIEIMKSQTPATQREMQAMILTQREGAESLMKALEQKEIQLGDLDASTRTSLENLRQPALKDRFAKLVKAEPASLSKVELIAAYQSALTLPGDLERGREHFKKTCSSCHKHQGIGNEFGPKLSALKSKSNDFLLTSILDPNAASESKYRGYAVATLSGKVFSGLILEETATSLKMARPDGKVETILRSEIEEIINTGRSFMPEGLEKSLPPQSIADLIMFIRSE